MGLTAEEAARILGRSRNHVYRLARLGRLPRDGEPQKWAQYDRETVEALSLAALPQYGGGHPYWATTDEAATILGVSTTRVRQLVAAGRLPAVRHGRRWVFRRDQLEVVANARDARKYAAEGGG